MVQVVACSTSETLRDYYDRACALCREWALSTRFRFSDPLRGLSANTPLFRTVEEDKFS
jgi:hypothetical protein